MCMDHMAHNWILQKRLVPFFYVRITTFKGIVHCQSQHVIVTSCNLHGKVRLWYSYLCNPASAKNVALAVTMCQWLINHAIINALCTSTFPWNQYTMSCVSFSNQSAGKNSYWQTLIWNIYKKQIKPNIVLQNYEGFWDYICALNN